MENYEPKLRFFNPEGLVKKISQVLSKSKSELRLGRFRKGEDYGKVERHYFVDFKIEKDGKYFLVCKGTNLRLWEKALGLFVRCGIESGIVVGEIVVKKGIILNASDNGKAEFLEFKLDKALRLKENYGRIPKCKIQFFYNDTKDEVKKLKSRDDFVKIFGLYAATDLMQSCFLPTDWFLKQSR